MRELSAELEGRDLLALNESGKVEEMESRWKLHTPVRTSVQLRNPRDHEASTECARVSTVLKQDDMNLQAFRD